MGECIHETFQVVPKCSINVSEYVFSPVPTSFLSLNHAHVVIKGSQDGNLIKICLSHWLLSSIEEGAL